MLLRRQARSRPSKLTPRSEGLWVGNSSDQSGGQHRPDARSFVISRRQLVCHLIDGQALIDPIELQNLCLSVPAVGHREIRQTRTGNLGQPLVICIRDDAKQLLDTVAADRWAAMPNSAR